jgi:hypothetical protein
LETQHDKHIQLEGRQVFSLASSSVQQPEAETTGRENKFDSRSFDVNMSSDINNLQELKYSRSLLKKTVKPEFQHVTVNLPNHSRMICEFRFLLSSVIDVRLAFSPL